MIKRKRNRLTEDYIADFLSDNNNYFEDDNDDDKDNDWCQSLYDHYIKHYDEYQNGEIDDWDDEGFDEEAFWWVKGQEITKDQQPILYNYIRKKGANPYSENKFIKGKKTLKENKALKLKRLTESTIVRLADKLTDKAEATGLLDEIKVMDFGDATDSIMSFIIEEIPDGDNELWSMLTNMIMDENYPQEDNHFEERNRKRHLKRRPGLLNERKTFGRRTFGRKTFKENYHDADRNVNSDLFNRIDRFMEENYLFDDFEDGEADLDNIALDIEEQYGPRATYRDIANFFSYYNPEEYLIKN